MIQSQEDMKQKIQRASNRKILRRQMELLAEWCRISGQSQIPGASKAMIDVNRELLKTERVYFVRFLIAIFAVFYLAKCILVKGIKFILHE